MTVIKNDVTAINALRLFKDSCAQKRCEAAITGLQQAVMGEDRYRNCDPIKLSYEPREIDGHTQHPCWRDYMIFRVSIYF
jgi:hypothetical protein